MRTPAFTSKSKDRLHWCGPGVWFGAYLLSLAGAAATERPPDALPTIPAEVQAEIRNRVDHRYSVAMVAGVVHSSGSTFYSYGTEDLDGVEAVDEDTVFEIGSVTKTFTGLLLADMVNRGEVRVEDPVQGYLPEGIEAPKHGDREMTLGDLASHVSGLPRMPANFAPADVLNPYADYGEQKIFDFLHDYTLTRRPGATYEYSNYAVGLLGTVLSEFHGMEFEALLQERILGVLGLTDTSIELSADQRRRLAVGYTGVVRVPGWDFGALAGAGALRSTARDMLAYGAANLGLRPSSLERAIATSHEGRITASPGLQVGLGWHILNRGGRRFVFHDGQTGGYSALVAFEQQAERAVVVLASGWNVAADLGFYLLDQSLGPFREYPVPAAVPVEQLRRYHGKFASNRGDSFLINLRHDHLVFSYSGDSGQSFTLYPATTNRFQAPAVPGDAQATFVINATGEVTGLRWTQSGATTLYSKRRLSPTLAIRIKDNDVALALTGDTGIDYVIERSHDLRTWSPIATQTIWSPEAKDVVQPLPSFYRVREP